MSGPFEFVHCCYSVDFLSKDVQNHLFHCFTQNIMIMGDFNADGSYVSKKGMKAIRIKSDKNFHWLISDDVDTTTRLKNDNTYDRFVTLDPVGLSKILDGVDGASRN